MINAISINIDKSRAKHYWLRSPNKLNYLLMSGQK